MNLMRLSTLSSRSKSSYSSGTVNMRDSGTSVFWYWASYLLTVCCATKRHLRSTVCATSNCDQLSHPCRAVVMVSCRSILNMLSHSSMRLTILSRKVCSSVTAWRILRNQESSIVMAVYESEWSFLTISLSFRLGCWRIQETSTAVKKFLPCSCLYSMTRLYIRERA